MLTAATTLLALGLLLMALAVRGRVVARGRFCRRCRFDLAGLGTEQGACPECGRDLNGPNAVRPVRRRASRPGIALAAGLLILGGGLATTALPGVGAWVAGRLTDRQILALSEHWDRALLELVSRTAVPASKLPQEVWHDAVERGLAHQGDLDAPWDPRWGAVLLHASFADAMSPEQAARYVRQAVEFEVVTPELIPADAERLPYQVVLTFRRVSSGGFEAISPAVSGALIEIAPPPEPGFTRPRFTKAGGHIFPGDPPRERVGHYSVPVPAAIDPEAEAVDVVFTHEILMETFSVREQVIETRSETRRIRLAPTLTDAAPVDPPSAGTTRAVRTAVCFPLVTIDPGVAEGWPARGAVFGLWIDVGELAMPVAARVEFRVGDTVSPASDAFVMRPGEKGAGAKMLLWRLRGDAENARASASAAVQAGKVDVILTTDRDHALANPADGRFMDLTLVFRDVPVVIAEDDLFRAVVRSRTTPTAADPTAVPPEKP